MTTLQTILEFAFWFSLAAVFYAYVGYPVVIYLLARAFGRRRTQVAQLSDGELPSASLLIAAHNEESVIEARLQNALAADYPKEKWEVVVVADGCSDRTSAIVRSYADRGVRLLDMSPRRGKSQALNDAMPRLKGEIVILSDANTDHHPQAARRLASWYAHSTVTTVCGRLILTDHATGRNVDGLYWRYETFIKKQEGALGALLGANGAIYAIRRNRYVPVPPNNVVDDFVIPLLAKLRHGGELVYDSSAVAYEETAPNIQIEFHRRSRIGAGGFGSLRLLAGLLNPARGWLCLAFLSHKVLRWCCPFFLLALLASSALLAASPLYAGFLVLQLAFYATAAVAAYLPGRGLAFRVMRLSSMFTSMNAALLFGFVRWLCNLQRATWQRTARGVQPYAVELPGAAPSAGKAVLP